MPHETASCKMPVIPTTVLKYFTVCMFEGCVKVYDACVNEDLSMLQSSVGRGKLLGAVFLLLLLFGFLFFLFHCRFLESNSGHQPYVTTVLPMSHPFVSVLGCLISVWKLTYIIL